MHSTTSLADRFQQTGFLTKFTDRLPTYLPKQRWFTSKGKALETVELSRAFPVSDNSVIAVIKNRYVDGSDERFQMPLAVIADAEERAAYERDHESLVVLRLAAGELLVDAVPLSKFRSDLYGLVRSGRATAAGLSCDTGKALHAAPATAPSVVPAIDTSNTAIVYADRFFFKLFRKLDEGLNPDLELVRFLSEKAGFEHCPPYGGSIGVGEMQDDDYLNLGMMSGKVDNQGDAWAFFQTLTERFYTGAHDVDEETLQRAALLGQRTAEMHQKLAMGATEGEQLAPAPMTVAYRKEITAAANKILERQMMELAEKVAELPEATRQLARQALDKKSHFHAQLEALAKEPMDLYLIRIHADYHLGQVLVTEDDFYIIDFEGEPLLTIPERRRKRPALKDVAGMVRSFHYAAHGQLLLNDRYSAEDRKRLSARADGWYDTVSQAYLEAYFTTCGDAPFLPREDKDRQLLLNLFMLEKAVYEVAYELNSRPKWLAIPLKGLLAIS